MTDPIVILKKELFYKFLKFGLIVLVGVSALAFLFVFINNQAKLIRNERAERAWLLESFNVIAALSADQGRAKELVLELEKIMPAISEIPVRVVPEIRNLAKNHNLKIDFNLGPERPASEAEPARIEFTLKADGLLTDIIDFFINLEGRGVFRFNTWQLKPIGGATHQFISSGNIYIRSSD